jgi:hypothetical protein
MEMIAKYYDHKYKIQTTILNVTSVNDTFDFEKLGAEIRKIAASHSSVNYRHPFICQLGPHSIPIIYIRENNEEGILFADSLSVSRSDAKRLSLATRMKVYAVLQQRQRADTGCKEDALVFGRDTCGLDSYTNRDRIPGLLEKLKNRSSLLEFGYYQCKLPDELLKTAQLSPFAHFHKEAVVRKIYKEKNIDQFRSEYSDTGVTIINSKGVLEEKKEVSSYLRIKGLKLAKIIEIQFYLDQFRALDSLWNKEIEARFIAEAKEILKNQEQSRSYIGLHSFAKKFLQELLAPQIEVVIDKMGMK